MEQFYNTANLGAYLCSQDAQEPPCSPSGAGALCGWRACGKVCWGSALGPLNNLHVNDQTKVPPTLVARDPLNSKALSFVLLSSPRGLESAASRHLANSLWGICHPLQALSLGKYISNGQAGFSNDPTDTMLGEMNASDKMTESEFQKQSGLRKMSRKEKRFQRNRRYIFHLSSKSNCSGVLVCLQVDMRQWCDVDAKTNQTNKLTCRIHYQKGSIINTEGWRRIGGLHTILQRRLGNQESKNSRNPVLCERNDLDREGAENSHPPYKEGTKSRFILGAPDSRTKDWWLDGDSICISTGEFSNNEKLWPQGVSGKGTFLQGHVWGLPFSPGGRRASMTSLASNVRRSPWVQILKIFRAGNKNDWNKNTDF